MSLIVGRKEAPKQHLADQLSDDALQNQMNYLLAQMEIAVLYGESLTSEKMVHLSQQLDVYVIVAQSRRMNKHLSTKHVLFEHTMSDLERRV
ncbi:hypothetical protein [Paenibacillus tyrfis]|uniref:Uncharacterized protein n=1 Tax=Paenibacillus tyrfis TaxID=1501230 RepID=A0A081P2J6_9BACL|nr:hypothetical protein [Paenibacillus tyrfis]KEQ24919.1 hypothetical protein ET33_06050 [Paenibacillus tyrfis]